MRHKRDGFPGDRPNPRANMRLLKSCVLLDARKRLAAILLGSTCMRLAGDQPYLEAHG
jgi:hypothetical protein